MRVHVYYIIHRNLILVLIPVPEYPIPLQASSIACKLPKSTSVLLSLHIDAQLPLTHTSSGPAIAKAPLTSIV